MGHQVTEARGQQAWALTQCASDFFSLGATPVDFLSPSSGPLCPGPLILHTAQESDYMLRIGFMGGKKKESICFKAQISFGHETVTLLSPF